MKGRGGKQKADATMTRGWCDMTELEINQYLTPCCCHSLVGRALTNKQVTATLW